LAYLPRVWHEIHKGLTSPLARDLKHWFEEMFPPQGGLKMPETVFFMCRSWKNDGVFDPKLSGGFGKNLCWILF
jgi:hypothetical protein